MKKRMTHVSLSSVALSIDAGWQLPLADKCVLTSRQALLAL